MSLLKLIAFAAGLYALIVVAAYLGQRKLMYFPDRARTEPALAGLLNVEERLLETADGERVIAWHGRAAPGQPTVLYFHGNAGSLVGRSERIRKYLARGLGMFMMTYRGYGGSTGTPSEAANVADGKLAYDWLAASGVRPADIILYGESLGSGVAAQVAADRQVGGVILDSPFTSATDVGAAAYPYLPVRLLIADRYQTLDYVPRLRAPLLVVHGEADSVVPVAMGRRIYAAAGEPKRLVTLPGAGHADHHMFGSYEAIFAWLDALRSSRLGLR